MFQRIRQRIRDMGTIKTLSLGAERHALRDGQQEPGAEHFLLSALELPDGSAHRAFERIHANPDGLSVAITQQHGDALRNIGVDPVCMAAIDDGAEPLASSRRLYQAKPSGQAVMQELAARRKLDKHDPLLGAHVVAVIASMRQGVTARALARMGIDLDSLGAAARDEISVGSASSA
jgi:hypothetical protein